MRFGISLIAFAPGCVVFGTFQSARPIEDGAVQVAVEPAATGTWAGVDGHEAVYPIGLSVRVGLDERTELGVRTGLAMPELQLKRLLSDPSTPLAVSLAATLGGWVSDLHGIPVLTVGGQLPLLLGVPLGDHELVFGPKLVWGFGHGLQDPLDGFLVSAGTSVGVSLQVAHGFRVMPEVTGLYPVVYVGSWPTRVGGGFAAQGGVAFLFGGGR